MSVETIVDAINTQLLTFSDVDAVSKDTFKPAITNDVVVLTLPFRSVTEVRNITLGQQMVLIHTLTSEFWIKHVNGAEATTMSLARTLGVEGIEVLVKNNGTGYQLYKNSPFVYSVQEGMVVDTSHPWLICELTIRYIESGCPV